MNNVLRLIAGFVFPLVSNMAVAITTLNTGPVSSGKPVGVGVRNIWCVTENLSKKSQSVTAELWHANNVSPHPQYTATYTLLTNQSSGYNGPGASGPNTGGVQVYCRFKVKTKSVRGYLTIEDDNATVLTIEAK